VSNNYPWLLIVVVVWIDSAWLWEEMYSSRMGMSKSDSRAVIEPAGTPTQIFPLDFREFYF
jgi:hypothetical protein